MFIWTYRRRAYVSSPRYEFIECIMNYNKGKFYQINYLKLKINDLLYLYFLFQKCSLNLEFDSLLKGSKVFALKMKLLKIAQSCFVMKYILQTWTEWSTVRNDSKVQCTFVYLTNRGPAPPWRLTTTCASVR